jgi:hypothetical protein
VRLLTACAVLSIAVLFAPAAPVGDKEKSGKPTPSGETRAEVRFTDGSFLLVSLLSEKVEIMTKYGKLTVPLSEVRHIEFGTRLPDAVLKRLENAAAKLGSDDFKEREAAAKDLLALKELAYPTLQQLAKNKDLEVATRAQKIMAELREKIPESKLNIKLYDTIAAEGTTIRGRVEGPGLKARSPYFGEVTLKYGDLRALRPRNGLIDQDLVVDASKYAIPGTQTWMATEIEISSETSLLIQASGEIDMYPIGGDKGRYMSGPKGHKDWGMPPGESFGPGTVLGRIGKDGKVFEIGDKYDGTPGQSGILYLRIVPSPWNNASTGEYKVKVEIR